MDEDVLRFKIPVNDGLLIKGEHAVDKLTNNLLAIVFGQTTFLKKHVLQVLFIAIF